MNVTKHKAQGPYTFLAVGEGDSIGTQAVPLAAMVRDNAHDAEVMEAILAVCDDPGLVRFLGGGASPLVNLRLLVSSGVDTK